MNQLNSSQTTHKERIQLENRNKILASAKSIIVNEGYKQLSMRYLAEKAQVSSKTPYNLFSSKARVLWALLQESIAEAMDNHNIQTDFLQVEALIELLDKIHQSFKKQHDYHRDIYWGIMSSDDVEVRALAQLEANELLRPFIELAVARKELKDDICVNTLANHLVLALLGNLGMWGGANLYLIAAMADTKIAWSSALLPYAKPKSKAILQQVHKEQSLLLGQLL